MRIFTPTPAGLVELREGHGGAIVGVIDRPGTQFATPEAWRTMAWRARREAERCEAIADAGRLLVEPYTGPEFAALVRSALA